jgi:hypothetical protein
LNESYGIRAADNYNLIVNIISWLLNKASSEKEKTIKPIYLTVPIEQDLYYWIKDLLNNGNWHSVEEVINYGLKLVKSNMKKQDDNSKVQTIF